MKRTAPPYLLEWILLFILSPRDRQTISGDLREEFLEVKLPGLGRFRADLWYFRQVSSFLPAKLAAFLVQGPALRLLCFCTAAAACWLGMMDVVLRHPGYVSQIGIAVTIGSQALLTLLALRFQRNGGLRAVAMAGSLPLLWLAASALKATVGGAHLEGYVLLIALALIAQAALTPLVLRKARVRAEKNV